MAPGEIEAVAAVLAGPPGLTLGNLARPRPAWPSRAPGRWRSLPFLAMQLRRLEVTRLVLPRHLAAERA